MKIKIDKFDFKLCESDEDYFSKEFIGSTEFSEFCVNGADFVSNQIEFKKLLESELESSALIFGSLFHNFLSNPKSFNSYSVGKNLITSKKMVQTFEIGIKDHAILSFILRKFPINLKALKEDSVLYEVEKGYHFDILSGNNNLKYRAKADLLVLPELSKELVIIDWKTCSQFGDSKYFKSKYYHQGELYSFLLTKVVQQQLNIEIEKTRFIDIFFSKDIPFNIYSETYIFDKNPEREEKLLENMIELTNLRNSENPDISGNISIKDDFLINYLNEG